MFAELATSKHKKCPKGHLNASSSTSAGDAIMLGGAKTEKT